MPVFYCIHCGQYLDADDDTAGMQGECPACLAVITVPPLRTAAPQRPAVELEPEPEIILPPIPEPEPDTDVEIIPPPPPIPASRFQVVIPAARLAPPPSSEEEPPAALVKTEPVPVALPETQSEAPPVLPTPSMTPRVPILAEASPATPVTKTAPAAGTLPAVASPPATVASSSAEAVPPVVEATPSAEEEKTDGKEKKDEEEKEEEKKPEVPRWQPRPWTPTSEDEPSNLRPSLNMASLPRPIVAITWLVGGTLWQVGLMLLCGPESVIQQRCQESMMFLFMTFVIVLLMAGMLSYFVGVLSMAVLRMMKKTTEVFLAPTFCVTVMVIGALLLGAGILWHAHGCPWLQEPLKALGKVI